MVTSVARLIAVTISTELLTFRLMKNGSDTIAKHLDPEAPTLDARQRQSFRKCHSRNLFVSPLAFTCPWREDQSRARRGFHWNDQTEPSSKCF